MPEASSTLGVGFLWAQLQIAEATDCMLHVNKMSKHGHTRIYMGPIERPISMPPPQIIDTSSYVYMIFDATKLHAPYIVHVYIHII